MGGQVPRLTNERPLTKRGDSWGALRNLAGPPGLEDEPGRGPTYPSPRPLGFVLILPTVMIVTIVQAFATLAEPFTCIFLFQLSSRRREALLPILWMRNLRLRRQGTSRNKFLLQLTF